MSNLLFFASGVAKGAGRALDEQKATYERQVEFTTRSLREELKAARLARKTKTDAATQRLEELEALGIPPAAAAPFLRLSEALYQTQLEQIMAKGSELDEGLSTGERLKELGIVGYDPSKPSTNEEIINRFVGVFPAAAIRPEEESTFRSGFARAFGFADPEDQAMEQAAQSLGISTDRAAALLDDTFERKAYESSVRLEPVITEAERLRRDTLKNQNRSSSIELTKRQQELDMSQRTIDADISLYNPVVDPETGEVRNEPIIIKAGTLTTEANEIMARHQDSLAMQATALQVREALGKITSSDIVALDNSETAYFSREFNRALTSMNTWGPGNFEYNSVNGQYITKTNQTVLINGFAAAAHAAVEAAQNVMHAPQEFGVAGNRNRIAVHSYILSQMPTINGQAALVQFNKEMSKLGRADQLSTIRLEAFDTLFEGSGADNFPQELKDYIKSFYTDPAFKARESRQYLRLLGRSPETIANVVSQAGVPGDGVPGAVVPPAVVPPPPAVVPPAVVPVEEADPLGETINALPDTIFGNQNTKQQQLRAIEQAITRPTDPNDGSRNPNFIPEGEDRERMLDLLIQLEGDPSVSNITQRLLQQRLDALPVGVEPEDTDQVTESPLKRGTGTAKIIRTLRGESDPLTELELFGQAMTRITPEIENVVLQLTGRRTRAVSYIQSKLNIPLKIAKLVYDEIMATTDAPPLVEAPPGIMEPRR
jgi:hypothetical protein